MVTRTYEELQRNDSDMKNKIIPRAIFDSIQHFKDECFAINQASYYATALAYNKTLSIGADGSTSIADPLRYAMIDLPSDFSSMIGLSLNKSGTMYDMLEVSYSEIDGMDALAVGSITNEDSVYTAGQNPHTGTPQYYAYFGEYSNVGSADFGGINGSSGTQLVADPGTSSYTPTAGKIRVFPRPDIDYRLSFKYVSNLARPDVELTMLQSSLLGGFWANEAQRMIKTYAKGIIYADYLQQYEQAQAQEVMAQAEFNRLVGRSEARAFDRPVRSYV